MFVLQLQRMEFPSKISFHINLICIFITCNVFPKIRAKPSLLSLKNFLNYFVRAREVLVISIWNFMILNISRIYFHILKWFSMSLVKYFHNAKLSNIKEYFVGNEWVTVFRQRRLLRFGENWTSLCHEASQGFDTH